MSSVDETNDHVLKTLNRMKLIPSLHIARSILPMFGTSEIVSIKQYSLLIASRHSLVLVPTKIGSNSQYRLHAIMFNIKIDRIITYQHFLYNFFHHFLLTLPGSTVPIASLPKTHKYYTHKSSIYMTQCAIHFFENFKIFIYNYR